MSCVGEGLPAKQGLKHSAPSRLNATPEVGEVLPAKQGLKLEAPHILPDQRFRWRGSSSKTRIETIPRDAVEI